MARYYRVDEQRNLPLSTEITGYSVSALLELYQRTGRSEYLNQAIAAGRYLRNAWNAVLGTMPFETDPPGNGFAYFFDLGIIARALLRLADVTGDTQALEVARRCGQSMYQDFAAPQGSHCILTLPAKTPLPDEPWWSRRPGAFHLKAALAWLELAPRFPEFAAPYQRQLDFSLAVWRELIDLEPQRERLMDRLHPLGYFLEGLLPVLHQPGAAEAFRQAVPVYAALLREIGPAFTRSDAYAQLLRARIYADAAGILPLDETQAAEEYTVIVSLQDQSGDPRRHGGYAFGTRQGQVLPFANPVSTAFCMQAVAHWHDRQAGKFQAHWRELI